MPDMPKKVILRSGSWSQRDWYREATYRDGILTLASWWDDDPAWAVEATFVGPRGDYNLYEVGGVHKVQD